MKGEYVPASANVVFMIATNASIRLFSFSCISIEVDFGVGARGCQNWGGHCFTLFAMFNMLSCQ